MLDRRRVLMIGGAAGLAACSAQAPRAAQSPSERVGLLVASGDVPAAGVVARRGGKTVFSASAGNAAGADGVGARRGLTATTKMRIASVSKLATTLTALRLDQAGTLPLSTDVRSYFDGAFAHPSFGGRPVTIQQLLGHTSGLRDPEVYWQAAPGRIEDLFTEDMWASGRDGPPGKYFAYSNFGYGIVATILERASGERFDRLAQGLVLEPLGLTAGFNWSGVPAPERAAGATLYRKIDGDWQVQTDGAEALNGTEPTSLVTEGFDLNDYEIGSNGTLFSPQGGLRASLSDMAVLARAAAVEPVLAGPKWRLDGRNGDTMDGYFDAFGTGLQINDEARAIAGAGPLIGHPGEAYGLYSGAWHLPDLDAEIAFAVTGSPGDRPPPKSAHPGFLAWEWELLQAGLEGLAAA